MVKEHGISSEWRKNISIIHDIRSGTIYNQIYNNGKEISSIDITDCPSLAYYEDG